MPAAEERGRSPMVSKAACTCASRLKKRARSHRKMLGQTLVTHQTGPAGRVVNKVLVAESAEIAREIYFAILLDRATAAPIIVASTEGGVEIEAVAEKSPEKIMREKIDPLAGLQALSNPQTGQTAWIRIIATEGGGEIVRRFVSHFHRPAIARWWK